MSNYLHSYSVETIYIFHDNNIKYRYKYTDRFAFERLK